QQHRCDPPVAKLYGPRERRRAIGLRCGHIGMLGDQRFDQLWIAPLHRIDQAEIAGQARAAAQQRTHHEELHVSCSYKYASRPELSPKPLQGTPALSNMLRNRLFNGVSGAYAMCRLPLKKRLPAISAIGRSWWVWMLASPRLLP